MTTNSPLFPEPKPVKTQEAQEVLNNAEFRADLFSGRRLTKEILASEGLIPTYKLVLPNVTMWLSPLYLVLGKRPAVVGYIQTEGTPVVIRSFYRSNSQGVWRYLADYRLNNGFFDWYAQGHASDTITASLILQKTLGEIGQNPTAYKKVESSDLTLAGTARERRNNMPYIGSAGKPVRLKGHFYSESNEKPAPETLIFINPDQEPNFDKRLTSWTKRTPIYDDISVEVYASKDASLHFMFCKDNEGRAWIAHVEQANGTFTSTGVITPWIDAGLLVAPAYEYTTLAGPYGNTEKRKGPYVDMYKNYLSKIPVIARYQHVR